ncbi:MAG: HAD-IIA family hydrolase [Thermomicrobiales bacterium]|nr:HAD-IIA family hydrolase [Thermomicrobiales bacterium]
MDGVLYRGDAQLPGVVDLINALEIRGIPYMLATNNSMSTPASYVRKLAKMGIETKPESILTSATATRVYVNDNLPAGSKIFVIGMPPLSEQLFDDSPHVKVEVPEPDTAAVVIGLDVDFTYAKLKAGAMAIRDGARFIATNTDATLPTEEGLVPGAGSIVSALATASGQQPTIIGKPEPTTLIMSARAMNLDPADCVMIGDRLDTDILAGARAGMLTALVLTGVSTRSDIPNADVLPDLVFTDLTALLAAFTGDPV